MTETVFLVAFFKFHAKGPEDGFKRMDLQCIFKTEAEAREKLYFCDEAGWYEGALIEERAVGSYTFRGKRVWFLQQEDGTMKETAEPKWLDCVRNIIG